MVAAITRRDPGTVPSRDVTTNPERRTSASRRAFLGGGALALGAAAAVSVGACSAQDTPTVETGEASLGALRLVPAFPVGVPYVATGVTTRLPWQIARGDGSLLDRIDGPVRFTVLRDGETVGAPIEVRARTEGLTRAYLPLLTTFPDALTYEIVAEVEGAELRSRLQAYDPAVVQTPQVGGRLPVVATPTVDNTLDVDPICTLSPRCPYHATSLDAAVQSGAPVAIIVGSDIYCADDECGPVLDLFVATAAAFPTVTTIHAEPYKNPTAVRTLSLAAPAPFTIEATVRAEPSTFFVDRTGTIVGRADSLVDGGELRELFGRIS